MKFESHFRDLFENSKDFICFLNNDEIIELVNPAWLSGFGYELNDVVGHSIYDFIHPDYRAEYRRNYKEAKAHHKIQEAGIAFITRGNEIIIGEGQIGCFSQNADHIYCSLVFKNITDQRQEEKVIEESEKRLKAFLNSGPDAVIIINEYQEILEWNLMAEAIFGFTAKEISGKTLAQTIIPFQHREAHNRGMQHFLETDEGRILNKTIEITALHKNGKEFYINLSISNVKLNDRWLFIAFLSDISERKRTEEILIKREVDLMQSKLMEEKKDEFISIASHELKTPVTTIKAYTQIALAKCKDCPDDVVMCLTKVNQFADKLTYLLNELLDVSKISLGKLNLSKKETNLNVYLPEVLDSIRYVTKDHKIVLEQNVVIKSMIDPIRLEQVITNLVNNSAKYSPGKENIVVRSAIKEGEIMVSFTDYCIGISPENIGKIFDRFYRVDETSGQFSGFGIGLFISSEIIKQHGGRICATSTEGKGSTLYFTLPISHETEQSTMPEDY
ncbi:MAG: PAS domain S-box protein [Ginsengibacter sp.]